MMMIAYLIPFLRLSGGLLGRLLSFDGVPDDFVTPDGIAEMEEIYVGPLSIGRAHNLHD